MLRTHRVRFWELCEQGALSPDDIDDFIDQWHCADPGEEIYEFLGLDRDDYQAWVKDPRWLHKKLGK